jgi:D-tyrosyl-tRNA(Tyr) deacylase
VKAVIQRVQRAEVKVNGEVVSHIGKGILTLLGIAAGDDPVKLEKVIKKICDLRIFEDLQGKMNLSLKDVQGSHLIVSQFTLLGDCSKGNRPSFFQAERPEKARELYLQALELSRSYGVQTEGGVFQAHMEVSLLNDGPVTLVLEV